MSNNQIYGQTFTPCFMTVEEFDEGYKTSEFYVDSNYMEEYQKHIVAMEHIAECAKIYILKNYQKVTDWSNLEVIVYDNKEQKSTKFYNHKPERYSRDGSSDTINKMLKRIEAKKVKEHNPIQSISDAVLDPTDGDFSVTINGQDFLWIRNDSIIIIANYIETFLKNNLCAI